MDDEFLYHGTTLNIWKNNPHEIKGTLYLTNNIKTAHSYGCQSAEWEYDDEIHDESNQPERIIVRFNKETLFEIPGIELDPDWGWVTALEHEAKQVGNRITKNITWEESLAAVGNMSIGNFDESWKQHGEILDADSMKPIIKRALKLR